MFLCDLFSNNGLLQRASLNNATFFHKIMDQLEQAFGPRLVKFKLYNDSKNRVYARNLKLQMTMPETRVIEIKSYKNKNCRVESSTHHCNDKIKISITTK